jgi:hypothetical protein
LFEGSFQKIFGVDNLPNGGGSPFVAVGRPESLGSALRHHHLDKRSAVKAPPEETNEVRSKKNIMLPYPFLLTDIKVKSSLLITAFALLLWYVEYSMPIG